MVKIFSLIIALLFTTCYAQENNSVIDVFVIDSYVTPETPHKVILTFFTGENVKAKIKFDGNDEFIVSNEFADEHRFELFLKKLNYDSTSIPYRILVENSSGVKSASDEFDLYLPEKYNFEIKNSSNFLDLCIGGIWYLFPSPTIVLQEKKLNLSLTKEFTIISFYSGGYNYPSGYIAIEYSHILNKEKSNYLRVGYKHIFQTEIIKYISPGINITTNFKGFNGVSPEISFGLFEFYDTFTLYARCRYNYNINNLPVDFMEFSIGLFTSSISFNF